MSSDVHATTKQGETMDFLASLAIDDLTSTTDSLSSLNLSVDNLTPSMIVDTYMDAKITSIKLAQARGYAIPDNERALLASSEDLTRAQLVEYFIAAYTEGNFLTLGSLTTIYELVEGDKPRESLIVAPRGRLPKYLQILFTENNVVIDPQVPLDETELIIVSRIALPAAAMKELQGSGARWWETVASSLAVWPLGNSLTPSYTLYKDYYTVEDIAEQLGVTREGLQAIKQDDPVMIMLGGVKGDVACEVRTNVDGQSIVTRSVQWRRVVE